MKPIIVLILLFFSISSIAQTEFDYKRQYDSLTIVHKVCILENSLRNHRVKMDQLKKQKQNLKLQLSDIESFKLGRTDAEKEEQLAEINELIEANSITYTSAAVQLTTLINDLVMAHEDVKELQNK